MKKLQFSTFEVHLHKRVLTDDLSCYSFWPTTLSCSLETERTPSALKNMSSELFPSTLISSRSLFSSCTSQGALSKRTHAFERFCFRLIFLCAYLDFFNHMNLKYHLQHYWLLLEVFCVALCNRLPYRGCSYFY